MKPAKYKRAAGTGPEKAEKRARIGFVGKEGKQGPRGERGPPGPVGPPGATGTFEGDKDIFVQVSGDQTIAGEKTFTDSLIVRDGIELKGSDLQITSGNTLVGRINYGNNKVHVRGEGTNTSVRLFPDGTGKVELDGAVLMRGNVDMSNNEIINASSVDADTLTLTSALGVSYGGTGATNLDGLVQTSGDQTIAGNKTFSGTLALTSALDVSYGGTGATTLDGFVQTSGDQTIAGNKTFSGDVTVDSMTVSSTSNSINVGSVAVGEGSLFLIDGVSSTVGTVQANKAVTVDSNKDVTGFRDITCTGDITSSSLSLSDNIEIGGDLTRNSIPLFAAESYAETTNTNFKTTAGGGNEWGNGVYLQRASNATLSKEASYKVTTGSELLLVRASNNVAGSDRVFNASLSNVAYAGIYRLQWTLHFENDRLTTNPNSVEVGIQAALADADGELASQSLIGKFRDCQSLLTRTGSQSILQLDFLVELSSTTSYVILKLYARNPSNSGNVFASSDLITDSNYTVRRLDISYTYMGPLDT